MLVLGHDRAIYTEAPNFCLGRIATNATNGPSRVEEGRGGLGPPTTHPPGPTLKLAFSPLEGER